MKICKYEGKTMTEALKRVKQNLGKDAVILHTRTINKGGLFGIGCRRAVEITASKDIAPLARAARRATEKPLARRLRAAYPQDQVSSLQRDVDSIKGVLRELLRESRHGRASELPEPLYNIYQRLIDSEVPRDVAQAIAERFLSKREAGDEAWEHVRSEVASYLSQLIPASGPIRLDSDHLRTVALIGPTGVGKTTTIAKIAANYKLHRGAQVALATIDTYRIAAVEQLRTIASIMEVPLEVVTSPTQLRCVMESNSDKDLLLVDTAGRSQKNRVRIGELRAFFDANPMDEIHLVLSAASSSSHIADVCRRFSVLSPTHILLTKLDEAVTCGSVIDIARRAGKPLSYITDGQDIPDDIHVAQPDELASMILGDAEQVEARE
jgi:flagellar biosynthesis protein FlhF